MHQVTATKAIDSRSQDQMGRIFGCKPRAGRSTDVCGGRGGCELGQQCGQGIDPPPHAVCPTHRAYASTANVPSLLCKPSTFAF
ncbi:unnamed protein product [Arctia plantaginis]|nr:unnamed protein product [Arctia plantaginis]